MTLNVTSLDDPLRLPRTSRNWLIPGWLPAERLTVLTGSASGKTELALQLAVGLVANTDRGWLTSFPADGTWQASGPARNQDQRVYGDAVFASWHESVGDVGNRLWDLIGAGMFGWVEGADIRQQLERIQFQTDGLGVGYIDMASCGPIWGPFQDQVDSSTQGLLAAGRELREQLKGLRSGLLIIDSAPAAIRELGCDHSQAVEFLADWEAWARNARITILLLDQSTARWHQCASAVLALEPAEAEIDRHACRLVADKVPWGPTPKPLHLTRKWCEGHGDDSVCFATLSSDRHRLPLQTCPNGAWGMPQENLDERRCAN